MAIYGNHHRWTLAAHLQFYGRLHAITSISAASTHRLYVATFHFQIQTDCCEGLRWLRKGGLGQHAPWLPRATTAVPLSDWARPDQLARSMERRPCDGTGQDRSAGATCRFQAYCHLIHCLSLLEFSTIKTGSSISLAVCPFWCTWLFTRSRSGSIMVADPSMCGIGAQFFNRIAWIGHRSEASLQQHQTRAIISSLWAHRHPIRASIALEIVCEYLSTTIQDRYGFEFPTFIKLWVRRRRSTICCSNGGARLDAAHLCFRTLSRGQIVFFCGQSIHSFQGGWEFVDGLLRPHFVSSAFWTFHWPREIIFLGHNNSRSIGSCTHWTSRGAGHRWTWWDSQLWTFSSCAGFFL